MEYFSSLGLGLSLYFWNECFIAQPLNSFTIPVNPRLKFDQESWK